MRLGLGNSLPLIGGVEASEPDVTAPVLQSIETSSDGLEVYLVYDEALDTNDIPTYVFDPNNTIDTVSITDNTVTIVMDVAFEDTDVITLSSSGTTLKDISGNAASHLVDEPVVNNTLENDPPTLVSAETSVDGLEVYLVYNENLNVVDEPTYTFSPSRIVSDVSILDDTVTIIVSTPFADTDVITISSSGTTLKDLVGNAAAHLTNEAVTNNTENPDITAPVLQSATVEDAAPADIVLVYDEPLGTDEPTYTITGKTVDNVAILGDTVTVTVTVPFEYTDVIEISSSGTTLKDLAGNAALHLTDEPVTNNIVDPVAPTLQSAETSSDGLEVYLVYDEDLDTDDIPTYTFSPARTVDSVDVTGDTVTIVVTVAFENGDVIEISSSGTTIKDLAGNAGAHLTDEPVTNNVPDTTAPALQSATVSVSGLVVTLVYDEDLDTDDEPTYTFSPAKTVSDVTITGDEVAITVTVSFKFGDVVTISSAGTTLKDLVGNAASHLSSEAVTNNSMEFPNITGTKKVDVNPAVGTTVTGSGVSEIINQGTLSANWVQATDANRPPLTATDSDFNNLPSMTFDGANYHMLDADFNANAAQTLFFVVGGSPSGRITTISSDATATNRIEIGGASCNYRSNDGTAHTFAATINTAKVISFVLKGGSNPRSVYAFQNGVAATNNPISKDLRTGTLIFSTLGRSGASALFSGKFVRALAYTEELSDADREKLENYLMEVYVP